MNDTFNLRRFQFVFVKTIVERPAQILGTMALSFSVVLLIYFLIKSILHFDIAQIFSFTLGLIGGGCLLASVMFGYFSDGASSASYLTLPASALEKWLCGVIIVGLIYLPAFLLYYRGMDALFVHLYHASLNPQDPRYVIQYNSVYLFSYVDNLTLFAFFLNAVCAMFVGSLYFNRISFIKVALVICGLYFIAFLLNYLVNSILFKDMTHSFPFIMVGIQTGTEQGIIILPSYLNKAFDITTFYILPSALLIISYIRLKEKEV
jgi:hypothetical protein